MEFKKERLKYQVNRLSSLFCYVAIALISFEFARTYVLAKPDSHMGLDILYNIVLLLVVFLMSEKVKVYSKIWGYISIAVGVIVPLRIFVIPMRYFKNNTLTQGTFIMAIFLLVVSAICLIVSGLICIHKANILEELRKNEPAPTGTH